MTFAAVNSSAGFSPTELAQLYGVTRQTVHYWIKVNPPQGHTHNARMAAAVTTALLQGVKSGKLPLPAMNPDARKRLVAQLAIRLQNLKPAPIK